MRVLVGNLAIAEHRRHAWILGGMVMEGYPKVVRSYCVPTASGKMALSPTVWPVLCSSSSELDLEPQFPPPIRPCFQVWPNKLASSFVPDFFFQGLLCLCLDVLV